MTRPRVTLACTSTHPRRAGVTCTQPFGHDGPHVNIDYPMAGQWSEEARA